MGRKVVISVPHGFVGCRGTSDHVHGLRAGSQNPRERRRKTVLVVTEGLGVLGKYVFNMIQLCCVAIGSSNRG